MLPFFTDPYPDELIYSAIARYHFYSGNIDYKDTLEEVFQSRSVIPSVEIGSHFSILAEQLGSNYSVESLLAKHTIYPYYASFLSKQRQKELLQDVQVDGKGLYTRLGIVAERMDSFIAQSVQLMILSNMENPIFIVSTSYKGLISVHIMN